MSVAGTSGRVASANGPMSTLRAAAMAIGVLLAFGGSVSRAHAQAAEAGAREAGTPSRADSEVTRLDAVEIRADRSLEERFSAASPRVTVNRADIEQMGADTVADVLQRLPGVQVGGAARGALEIRMRGMDRQATQILIDGQRIGGGRATAQLPFDQLPADMIERIEVLRAPSAEYAGASGGTINIVMREGSVRAQTQLRASVQQAFGDAAPRVFFSRSAPLDGPPARWTSFVSLSASERLWGSDLQRAIDGGDGGSSGGTDRLRGRTRELVLMPRINGRLSSTDSVVLRATLVAAANDNRLDSAIAGLRADGVPFAQRSLEVGDSHRQMAQLRADWTHRFATSRLDARLSAERSGERIGRDRAVELASGEPLPAASAVFGDRREERSLQAALKLGGAEGERTWMGGIEFESRQLDVETATGSGGAPVETRGLASGFSRRVLWGQNAWALPGRMMLSAGLRAESLNREATDGALRRSDGSTHLQPSLHLRAPLPAIGPDWQWRVNLARTRRLPPLTDTIERVVPSWGGNSPTRPDSIGNPELRPESTLSLDAGLERRLPRGGQGGVNLFVRAVDDLIVRRVAEVGGRWQQRPDNLGQARVWGVEADLKSPLQAAGLRGWNLSASASLLGSRVDDGAGWSGRIPGQAHYLANLGLARPMPRGEGLFGGAALILRGASDLGTGAGSAGREHARTSLEFHVGQTIAGFGFWRLDVHNIGNARARRERVDVDASGAARSERAVEVYGPRAVFTVGSRW